jgi:uncharacterized protein (TIGR04255 family)
MTQTARFDPIYPAHAIERCSASFVFDEPITEKAFQKLRNKADASLSQAQLLAQPQPNFGFQIDATNGVVTPRHAGVGSVNYSNSDRSITCTITPSAIVWSSARYLRWQPFAGQLEQFVLPLLQFYEDLVSLQVVKLDYLDRFFWTGDWSDFNADSLLQSHAGKASKPSTKAYREWHSHSGWFEETADQFRRLVNINIDAVGALRPGETVPVPSIGIYTMIQDQSIVPDSNIGAVSPPSLGCPLDRLDNQHEALKLLLAGVINTGMADRIALNARKP